MEHIVTSGIMHHAHENDILYDLQHGFRDRKSCETQLIEGEADRCADYGFFQGIWQGRTLTLIAETWTLWYPRTNTNLDKSFLSNRKQRVVLEGGVSDEVDVLSSVPQGSVLDPCLFLCYINDVPDEITSKVRLFADDTIMYLSIMNNSDTTTLQRDLDKLAEWETKWQMQFHPGKCQVLNITSNRTIIQHDYILQQYNMLISSMAMS